MSDITPDLGAKAAELRAHMADSNPSVDVSKKAPGARRRMNMTSPQRRLETAKLPGFHLQWIRGTPDRIQQAIACGFEFVKQGEVETNAAVLGTESLAGISTDLGDNISIPDGAEVIAGQGLRLHLMKQPQEYYDEDQKVRYDDIEHVRDALMTGTTGAGQLGETSEDASHRFLDRERTRMPDLFRKNKPPKPVKG